MNYIRMNNLPEHLKNYMRCDPFYEQCCLTGWNHEKIDWHHHLQFAGKQVQESFCIIPLAKSLHDNIRSDQLIKDLCDWIVWNRATDEQIKKYSKCHDYRRRLNQLNKRFGEWKPKKYLYAIIKDEN